jgi:hypothetical protein
VITQIGTSFLAKLLLISWFFSTSLLTFCLFVGVSGCSVVDFLWIDIQQKYKRTAKEIYEIIFHQLGLKL